MISRRAILVLCCFISVLAHFALYYVAPDIELLGASVHPAQRMQRYTVKIQDISLEQSIQMSAGGDSGDDGDNGTGDMQEMLARENTLLKPDESSLDVDAAIPELDERIATESLEREYETARDDAMLSRVDAKILEIAQDIARPEIEVPRRVVRPSPERMLAKNELPVIRTDLGDLGPGPMKMPPVNRGAMTGTGTGVGTGDGVGGPLNPLDPKEAPDFEDIAFDQPEPEALPIPALEVKDILARAPVTQAVRAAREQSDYTFMDNLVDIKMDTFMPTGQEEGYFRLRIVPKQDQSIEVLPKDITYVIDASSSILQRKLTETARGVSTAIDGLKETDHFNVVIFRDSHRPFRPGPIPATAANKADAKEYLANLESKGETDVYAGIQPALQIKPRDGVPGIIMIATDGRPTKGLQDSRSIINSLTNDNTLGNTIYTFGGGNSANRELLDLLSYRNKGETGVTDKIEDIDTALPNFLQRLNDPLLVHLNANYGRVGKEEVFPKMLPDFYKGQVVTVYGRFKAEDNNTFVMRLSGQAGSKDKEIIFRADLAEAAGGDAEIAKNWAFQKAYHLIGRMTAEGETPALLGEIRDLSRNYGIRTSYDE